MNTEARYILLGVIIFFAIVLMVISYFVRRRMARYQQSDPQFDQGANAEFMDDVDIPEADYDRFSQSSTSANTRSPQAQSTGLGFDELDEVVADFELENQNAKAKPAAPQVKSENHIIVLYVLAKPDRNFVGYELLQALLGVGLRYGDMSIFHRHENTNGTGKKLFSLASAMEPGVFDMNKMGAFATTGLCMFMHINGPEHNIETLNLMLKTAQQIADDLEGAVCDGKRKPLTEPMILSYREMVRQAQNGSQNGQQSGQKSVQQREQQNRRAETA